MLTEELTNSIRTKIDKKVNKARKVYRELFDAHIDAAAAYRGAKETSDEAYEDRKSY